MSDDEGVEIPLLLDAPPGDAVELPTSGKLLEGLSELVRFGMMGKNVFTAGKTFRLKLPPELAAEVASGKLSMMQAACGGIRSAVVNQKGTIVGGGSLHAVAAAPLVAVALWQLAAKITSNHFLAEIDARLASLDSKLEDIIELMHDEWKGVLQGSMRKLASISREIRASEPSDAELGAHHGVIEDIDLSARQIAVQAELRAKRLSDRVRRIEPRVTPMSDRLGKKAQHITALLRDIDEVIAQEYFALYVRALCVQVRSALRADATTTFSRLEELDEDRTRAATRSTQVLQLAYERISAVKGLLTKSETDDDHRQQLLRERWAIISRFDELDKLVATTARSIRGRHEARAASNVWLVLDETGRVERAYVSS